MYEQLLTIITMLDRNSNLLDSILPAAVTQLAQINVTMTKLTERVEQYAADLEEFSERFEEAVEQMWERARLDWQNDLN